MLGQRATWWVLAIAALGTLAAVSAGPDEAAAPVRRPAAAPRTEERSAPDEATVRERQRRALLGLMARRESKRRVSVAVLDCYHQRAAGAEVDVVAGGRRVSGRADESGRFRADIPASAAEIAVSARAAGPATESDRALHRGAIALAGPGAASAGDDRQPTREPGPIDVELSICPGASLYGVVQDEAGQPLAGAWVELGEDVALTEADGEFALTDLWLEAGSVRVSHASGVLVETLAPLAAGEERRVVLRLEGGRRVVGMVVDARGDAAADVSVRAYDAAGEVVASVMSDRQGRFWLKRLPLAPLTLRADGGSRGIGELRLGERVFEDSLVIRLAAQGVLVATWRGAPGVGLVAIPEQTPWEPSWSPGENPYARPIESGREVLMLAPRYWRVEVHDGDLVEPCGEGLLTPGGRLEIDCGDSGWAELVGQVVDEDGRPVAGQWWFKADGYLQGPIEASGTLHDGRLVGRLNVTRGTSGSLVVTASGKASLERQAISISPGRRTDLGRMVILSEATVAERFPDGWRAPFGGIGARISSSNLGISLTAIARGGPLDAAGVLAGDIVIAIDGTPAGWLPTREAVKLLRGRPGTPLHLQLLRPDAMILDIDIERGLVDTRSVDWLD